ncbi:MAG: chemotaxis-specific protein-glutamate methyltransferase CheB [Thermodesulfobacteriota bacterium]|nr:chemotaxis-specific protein-glutamate methyltransferase CheB [Thermodesulfobacteriota bacterium]
MIKVLVVDDSITVRKKIVEIVEKSLECTVVGEAKNGREAFNLVELESPDVIVMDLAMPVMDGQEATELIMSYHPTPIIIHSSAANRGEDYKTIDALSAGALDFVEKMVENWEEELIFKIKRASRIKVVTHLKKKKVYHETFKYASMAKTTQCEYNLLVMGASTGGPKATLDILCHLPQNFPIPIVVVIHVADSFRNSLCDWLNNNSGFDVRIPQDNDSLFDRQGVVYLAPPSKHLIVAKGKLRLTCSPEVNFCRPSIDVLFQSVAHNHRYKAIGILLTGMGRDGALGLKAIRDSGGYTIVQDQNTSIVFGMPNEAIKIGAATIVLPHYDIPDKVMSLVKAHR